MKCFWLIDRLLHKAFKRNLKEQRKIYTYLLYQFFIHLFVHLNTHLGDSEGTNTFRIMSKNILRSGTCPSGKWSNFSQPWAVKLQFIYVNPTLMIVHSPTLSSAYGSMREGCWNPGCTDGTHGDRERASPTELSLYSHPLNRRKRCTSARNSVKHGVTVPLPQIRSPIILDR